MRGERVWNCVLYLLGYVVLVMVMMLASSFEARGQVYWWGGMGCIVCISGGLVSGGCGWGVCVCCAALCTLVVITIGV